MIFHCLQIMRRRIYSRENEVSTRVCSIYIDLLVAFDLLMEKYRSSIDIFQIPMANLSIMWNGANKIKMENRR